MKNLSKQVGVYRRPNLTNNPRHPLIPIGTVFGCLTVVENDLSKTYSGVAKRVCRLRCECGGEAISPYNHLRAGKSTSCGCIASAKVRDFQKSRNPLIPIGTLIGRWTVLKNNLYRSYGHQKKRACRVRCECGTERVLPYAGFRRGSSPSCGCISKEHDIETVWRDLLAKHQRRGWECHLTLPQMKLISQLPCAYCGREPSNIHRLKYKVDGRYQRGVDPSMEIRWSGIDRVDSSKGYVVGNVVPCCIPCNRMKTNHHLDTFFDLMERIRAHNPTVAKIHQQAATLFDSFA